MSKYTFEVKEDYPFSVWTKPDGTKLYFGLDTVEELNALLARAERLEADACLYAKNLEHTKSYLQDVEGQLEKTRDLLSETMGVRDAALSDATTAHARRAKAEAELESARKMADHWEKRAQGLQGVLDVWKSRAIATEEAASSSQAQKAEPSRLEIAAMAMQGILAYGCCHDGKPQLARECVDLADALIAAAKETKQ